MLTSIGLILAGAMFLYCGIRIRNHHRRLDTEGVHTQALVINSVEESGFHSHDDHMHTTRYNYPVVKFSNEEGVEVTKRLNSTIRQSQVGEYINIAYIKHQIDGEIQYEIIINTPFWRTQFPLIFIVLGALMALATLVRLVA